MLRSVGLVAILWLCSATATCADSPASGSVERAVQVGLQVPLFSYVDINRDFAGASVDQDVFETRWGTALQAVILDVGYGIADHLILGGLVVLGGTSASLETEGSSEVSVDNYNFSVGPKLDWILNSDTGLVPFVGGMALLQFTSRDNEGTDTEDSSVLLLLLGRVGGRTFVHEHLSFEAALSAGVGYGSGDLEQLGGETDYGVTAYQFGISVGASLWN